MSENDQVATPVPAATILLLRDGKEDLEVFMVVRHQQIDFASGALVFPGGKVDEGDCEVRELCEGAEGLHDVALSMRVAAIREAFEESGILLARDASSGRFIDRHRLGALDGYRTRLNEGDLSLRDFLVQERLHLACGMLTHFAHWITPEMMPRRYDTHFFLTPAPEDQRATHDGYESVDSIWISPGQALKEAAAGMRTVIFPTRMNVELLGRSHSVADAIDAANRREIVPVLPWTERREDGNYLCIPAEAGYSVTEEKM